MSMSFEEGKADEPTPKRRSLVGFVLLAFCLLALVLFAIGGAAFFAKDLDPQTARFAMRAVPAGLLALGGVGAAVARRS